MNIFLDEHFAILRILLKHRVDFLLVGGVAVNFYGYSRPTGDLDVWLKPDAENRSRFVQVLKELKIHPEDVEKIKTTDFTQAAAFHIGKPPFVIDFLTKMAGVKWEEAWEMRRESKIDELDLFFIHINHLKQNKLLAGRPKDHEDIRQLIRIEELRRKS